MSWALITIRAASEDSHLTQSHSKPADEAARIQATIARLRHEQDRASVQDRPAMVHACELLIGIQAEKLREMQVRGSGPNV
jgi:hypothetical protein